MMLCASVPVASFLIIWLFGQVINATAFHAALVRAAAVGAHAARAQFLMQSNSRTKMTLADAERLSIEHPTAVRVVEIPITPFFGLTLVGLRATVSEIEPAHGPLARALDATDGGGGWRLTAVDDISAPSSPKRSAGNMNDLVGNPKDTTWFNAAIMRAWRRCASHGGIDDHGDGVVLTFERELETGFTLSDRHTVALNLDDADPELLARTAASSQSPSNRDDDNMLSKARGDPLLRCLHSHRQPQPLVLTQYLSE
jgi:hypothetical protein